MGNKAGFNEDQLFDIASVCMDNKASSPPATPATDQTEVYVKDRRVYKKGDDGIEKVVGPQDADEVDFDTGTSDNNAVGDTVQDFINKACAPTNSQLASYLANGEVDYIEIFSSSTQTTPNRVARVDFTYDGNLNPTTEAWKHYDTADGTTVLKTFILTHSWIGADYDKTTSATT